MYKQITIEKWIQGCIFIFSNKSDIGIIKNYRGKTLTDIAAKVYNTQVSNRIRPEIEKILWKNQNGFGKNRYTTLQILTIYRIIEWECANILETTLLFAVFSMAFDFIHRENMKQQLLAYSFLKETVTTIMMFYKNTKSNGSLIWGMHRLLRRCRRNPLSRYISIIFVYTLPWLHTLNVNKSNKRKRFHIIKK